MCVCVLIPIKSFEEGTVILLQEPVTRKEKKPANKLGAACQLYISSAGPEGLRRALLSLGLQGKPERVAVLCPLLLLLPPWLACSTFPPEVQN